MNKTNIDWHHILLILLEYLLTIMITINHIRLAYFHIKNEFKQFRNFIIGLRKVA